MSDTMNTKQGDTLRTQNNVEETPNSNSSLTEREEIPGTPFTLIKLNDQWFITMGDYRITHPTPTKEEQIKKLETEKWLIIMHIAVIVQEKMKQL